jgi:hypothetical protein
VDLKAENFRVIFTDFKNASNDVVIEATTVRKLLLFIMDAQMCF